MAATFGFVANISYGRLFRKMQLRYMKEFLGLFKEK
jgi:hypothetical protein